MNNFLFIGLPYAAVTILIIGGIYKYVNRGFQISSLSSQFLEGKKLFWGSQFFHWGIVTVLLGHLIGILFPQGVIAWNGVTVRLLILETTGLMFALSTLIGLILLIIRRLTNKRISIVTSKADVLVYVILLIQVITGIWVALGYRWGSSWYAASMTPYIKSLFLFSPEVGTVSQMPLIIKAHVISAFVMIGLIPFTRFSHFLVFPFRYYWRVYQQVIWNRDRKTIRKQDDIRPGVKSKNN